MTTFTTCDAGLGTGKALPLGENDISREGKVCGNSEPSSTWIMDRASRRKALLPGQLHPREHAHPG